MKILSLFNNKGGVGKTTLTYHLAHILATPTKEGGLGKRVLIMDLDPQCNLTAYALESKDVQDIWTPEDDYIKSYRDAKNKAGEQAFEALLKAPRSIHFTLKHAEVGGKLLEELPPPVWLREDKEQAEHYLGLIPGRLTLSEYETKVTQSWGNMLSGDETSVLIVTQIRALALLYAKKYNLDFVLMDTSPSLGNLNKIIISMADGFLVPCFPDIFSLEGLKNIGTVTKTWQRDLRIAKYLMQENFPQFVDKFPKDFVQFLGYTIYNARKYDTVGNHKMGLSQAHYNYAIQFPEYIDKYIQLDKPVPALEQNKPIGDTAIMYAHNTFPNMAQYYKIPMWALPTSLKLAPADKKTISGNKKTYEDTKPSYKLFAEDLLKRVAYLDEDKVNTLGTPTELTN